MNIGFWLSLGAVIVSQSWAAKSLLVHKDKWTSESGVVYVDAKARGLGDGTSWKNAFTDLSEALEKRSKWEIWVAAGTYKPGRSSDSVGSTFHLGVGVVLHGGFKGNETYLMQAKPNVNLTILSGDVGKEGNDSDNVNTVVVADGDNLLDGFQITDGHNRDVQAGGISSIGEIELTRCVFKNNWSKYGTGAAILTNGNVLVSECIFQGNSGPTGGGINAVGATLGIFNCVFYGNSSERWGGGILLQAVERAEIANSSFHMNSSPIGSALSIVAASEHVVSDVAIENCIFWKNQSKDGKNKDESEILVAHIQNNNSTILTMKACIVKGGKGSRSSGIRIQDTSYVRADLKQIKDADPLFLIEKNNAGLFGKDNIPFTQDDGLNVGKGSPAIDGGIPVNPIEHDIVGRNRSIGKATDIGAYEK